VLNTTFQSKVYYDEPTNQYAAEVDDFLGDGVGDTAETAIEMALDNIEALVEHFF
jgi:predicted RNase H-like HicB family nuclease